MTDSEILKAVGYCATFNDGDCSECPYESDGCRASVVFDAWRLINRQKEMIDALIAGQETLQKCIAEKDAEIEELKPFKAQVLDVIRKNITETKSEAINDFVKLVNRRLNSNTSRGAYLYNVMKEVEKEMVGENNV